MKRAAERGPLHTFRWPLVLAVVTVVALVVGLLGTGWIDELAVVLLLIPTVFCGWIISGRRRP